MLGVGWTNTSPEVNAVNASNQPVKIDGNSLFAFNLGIGTIIDMNPKVGVRLDARWRVTDTNVTTSSGVYCDYWGYCWTYASDWYNSGEFTAGLQYKFGGH
jgi:opacity protein-like surface antigen